MRYADGLKIDAAGLTFLPDYVIIGVMTLFDDNRYDWRETYFVYFESSHRPKLTEVRCALRDYTPFLSILDYKTEPDGSLVSMTIASYEDHAALEIVHCEGDTATSDARHFASSWKEEASEEECLKLQKIVQCKMRFDVHHFEQTADTHVFNITKVPELNFPKQPALPIDMFSRALKIDEAGNGKFHFDLNCYDQCHSDHAGAPPNDAIGQDSGITERINPEMLITVLEILCRISRGVILDPSSGIVL